MLPILCPCTSGFDYEECCKPYHTKQTFPIEPEGLMRSRYCAYALHLIDYLVETTHISKRRLQGKEAIKSWAINNTWLRLEICNAHKDIVEFKAYYENNRKLHIHHERSTFKKEDDKWYYLNGIYFD